MSLISIIQGSAASVNVPQPSAVAAAIDANAVQWLVLAKRELRELARRHDWQNLIVQHTWVTAATVDQPLALPSDYDRLVPDVEIWDRTSNTMLSGPTPSWMWQRLQSSGTTGGTTGSWRIIGNVLNIYPAPTAGRTYALEYVSTKACQSSGATAQVTWLADDDTARVPEHLVELGVTWRWLRAKSLDYAEEMSTYEREIERATARDRGLRIMVVSNNRTDLPDTSWPGVIVP